MPETNEVKIKLNNESVTAEAKTFSTGSTGYYFGGKVTLDGKKYQVSCSIVLVGSKPAQAQA